MSLAGRLLVTIQMLVLVVTAHAAPKWISGKPTRYPRPTPHTPARQCHKPDARVMTVEAPTPLLVTRVSATLMGVISTHTVWETRPSTAKVLKSTPARSSPSSLNSSAPHSQKSNVSTSKTTLSFPTLNLSFLTSPVTRLPQHGAMPKRLHSEITTPSRIKAVSHL